MSDNTQLTEYYQKQIQEGTEAIEWYGTSEIEVSWNAYMTINGLLATIEKAVGEKINGLKDSIDVATYESITVYKVDEVKAKMSKGKNAKYGLWIVDRGTNLMNVSAAVEKLGVKDSRRLLSGVGPIQIMKNVNFTDLLSASKILEEAGATVRITTGPITGTVTNEKINSWESEIELFNKTLKKILDDVEEAKAEAAKNNTRGFVAAAIVASLEEANENFRETSCFEFVNLRSAIQGSTDEQPYIDLELYGDEVERIRYETDILENFPLDD